MRNARELVLIAAVAMAAGCASSPGAGRPDVSQTMRISGGGGADIAIGANVTAAANAGNVTAPLAAVWNALPQVFDSLSIPVATIDPAQHLMGNSGFKVRHRLGKTALSRFIDCGEAQAQPSADTYDVQLSVLTELQPSDSGTTVSTTVDAVGRPVDTSGDYIHCSSKSALEPLIVKALNARLHR